MIYNMHFNQQAPYIFAISNCNFCKSELSKIFQGRFSNSIGSCTFGNFNMLNKNEIVIGEIKYLIIETAECCVFLKETIKNFRSVSATTKIIIISSNNCLYDWLNFFRWGVDGYILNDLNYKELEIAINSVNKYGVYLPSIYNHLFIEKLLSLQEEHPSKY